MGWMFDNWVANLSGFSFLLGYWSVAIPFLAVAAWALYREERTSDTPAFRLTADVDPVELAYLRGGRREVLRLHLFDLVRQGHAAVVPGEDSHELRAVTEPTDWAELPEAQVAIMRAVAMAPSLQSLYSDRAIMNPIDVECRLLDESLRARRLFRSATDMRRGHFAAGTTACVLIGLAGYRFVATLYRQHESVLPDSFSAIAVLAAIVLLGIAFQRRSTRRGRAYIEHLQQAFTSLQEDVCRNAAVPQHLGEDSLLVMALYGAGVFSAGPLDTLAAALTPRRINRR